MNENSLSLICMPLFHYIDWRLSISYTDTRRATHVSWNLSDWFGISLVISEKQYQIIILHEFFRIYIVEFDNLELISICGSHNRVITMPWAMTHRRIAQVFLSLVMKDLYISHPNLRVIHVFHNKPPTHPAEGETVWHTSSSYLMLV